MFYSATYISLLIRVTNVTTNNKYVNKRSNIQIEMPFFNSLQKFNFIVKEIDSDQQLVTIINLEPRFIIPEPKQEKYKFVVVALNEKGQSSTVEIAKEDIINITSGNISTIK